MTEFVLRKEVLKIADRPQGYYEHVLSLATSETEDTVTLTQESYNSLRRIYSPTQNAGALAIKVSTPRLFGGPGSWLKWLLATLLRQVASQNCSCNAKASQMDQWGCRACLWNLRTIVGWLGEEAGKRKLRFSRIGAGCLILAAISLAAGEKAYRKCRLGGNRK